MARKENQKLKITLIQEILEHETDSEHGIGLAEIISRLASHGVQAERKSLYDDFNTLRSHGEDILRYKKGNQWLYALVSRPFELAELKLLVDAVQSSKALSEKKSRELIKKLETLCSKYEAQSLQRQVYVTGRVKSMNESIYYSIDTIHTAINADRQIQFLYAEWTMEKKHQYRHGGKMYQVSPYALVWDNEFYYLVAWDNEAGALKHYRADKMAKLAVVEEPRQGKEAFEKVDMAAYTKQTFGMFGGEGQDITMRFASHLAGAVIDRFGKDVALVPHPETDTFTVHFKAVVSPQFMGWVAAFGDEAKIEAPAQVAQDYRAWCEKIVSKY